MSLGGVCGSGVSYPRAVVSCVPLVGTLVTLYNKYEVEKELKQAGWDKRGDFWQVVLETNKRVSFLLNRERPPVQISAHATACWKTCAQLPQMKLLLRKQLVYTTCALINNILVLAGSVTLVALGILTGLGGWVGLALAVISVGLGIFRVYESPMFSVPLFKIELPQSVREEFSKGRQVRSLVDLPYKPKERSSIDFLDPAMTSKPRLGKIDKSLLPYIPL